MSRDQRRPALKGYLKEYERGGVNPDRLPTLFGLVRDLADILEDSKNTRRMSDAGAYVYKVYDACAKTYAGRETVACKKGCGFCCHTVVTITAPEIFVLARAIQDRWNDPEDSFKADFNVAEARTRGLSLTQRQSGRVACPLLSENSCSVYVPRPLACRGHISKSLSACLDLYHHGVGNIPQPLINQALRAFIFAGLHAALSLAHFDIREFELGHALQVALQPRAEARWLAGEAIFDGVGQADQAPERAQGRQDFQLLVQVLMAGAYGKDVPANPWFGWAN